MGPAVGRSGMAAGEEDAAAPQVSQDAGGIRVPTALPHTRLWEGGHGGAAGFGACSSSPCPSHW